MLLLCVCVQEQWSALKQRCADLEVENEALKSRLLRQPTNSDQSSLSPLATTTPADEQNLLPDDDVNVGTTKTAKRKKNKKSKMPTQQLTPVSSEESSVTATSAKRHSIDSLNGDQPKLREDVLHRIYDNVCVATVADDNANDKSALSDAEVRIAALEAEKTELAAQLRISLQHNCQLRSVDNNAVDDNNSDNENDDDFIIARSSGVNGCEVRSETAAADRQHSDSERNTSGDNVSGVSGGKQLSGGSSKVAVDDGLLLVANGDEVDSAGCAVASMAKCLTIAVADTSDVVATETVVTSAAVAVACNSNANLSTSNSDSNSNPHSAVLGGINNGDADMNYDMAERDGGVPGVLSISPGDVDVEIIFEGSSRQSLLNVGGSWTTLQSRHAVTFAESTQSCGSSSAESNEAKFNSLQTAYGRLLQCAVLQSMIRRGLLLLASPASEAEYERDEESTGSHGVEMPEVPEVSTSHLLYTINCDDFYYEEDYCGSSCALDTNSPLVSSLPLEFDANAHPNVSMLFENRYDEQRQLANDLRELKLALVAQEHEIVEKDELIAQLKLMIADNGCLKQAYDDAIADFAHLKADTKSHSDRLEADLRRLKEENEQLTRHIAEMSNNVALLNATINDKCFESQQLAEGLALCEGEISQLREYVKTGAREATNMADQLKVKDTMLENANHEMALLTDEVARLRAELAYGPCTDNAAAISTVTPLERSVDITSTVVIESERGLKCNGAITTELNADAERPFGHIVDVKSATDDSHASDARGLPVLNTEAGELFVSSPIQPAANVRKEAATAAVSRFDTNTSDNGCVSADQEPGGGLSPNVANDAQSEYSVIASYYSLSRRYEMLQRQHDRLLLKFNCLDNKDNANENNNPDLDLEHGICSEDDEEEDRGGDVDATMNTSLSISVADLQEENARLFEQKLALENQLMLLQQSANVVRSCSGDSKKSPVARNNDGYKVDLGFPYTPVLQPQQDSDRLTPLLSRQTDELAMASLRKLQSQTLRRCQAHERTIGRLTDQLNTLRRSAAGIGIIGSPDDGHQRFSPHIMPTTKAATDQEFKTRSPLPDHLSLGRRWDIDDTTAKVALRSCVDNNSYYGEDELDRTVTCRSGEESNVTAAAAISEPVSNTDVDLVNSISNNMAGSSNSLAIFGELEDFRLDLLRTKQMYDTEQQLMKRILYGEGECVGVASNVNQQGVGVAGDVNQLVEGLVSDASQQRHQGDPPAATSSPKHRQQADADTQNFETSRVNVLVYINGVLMAERSRCLANIKASLQRLLSTLEIVTCNTADSNCKKDNDSELQANLQQLVDVFSLHVEWLKSMTDEMHRLTSAVGIQFVDDGRIEVATDGDSDINRPYAINSSHCMDSVSTASLATSSQFDDITAATPSRAEVKVNSDPTQVKMPTGTMRHVQVAEYASWSAPGGLSSWRRQPTDVHYSYLFPHQATVDSSLVRLKCGCLALVEHGVRMSPRCRYHRAVLRLATDMAATSPGAVSTPRSRRFSLPANGRSPRLSPGQSRAIRCLNFIL